MRFNSFATASIVALSALSAGCHGDGHDPEDTTDSSVSSASKCNIDPTHPDAACPGAISVSLNTCPVVSLTATPLHVAPGVRVLFTGTIFDAENDPVTQEWSADPDGTFDLSADPDVYYECESIGRKTISVVVKDEHGCASMETLDVACIDAPLQNDGPDPLAQP